MNQFDSSLYYKGSFKQFPTLDIINIVKANLGKDYKKSTVRLIGYLLVEIIQNIERYSEHSFEFIDDVCITKSGNQFVVTTRNVIRNEDKKIIEEKISSLNDEGKEELKEIYRNKLETNIIVEGHGAGLGFIEMVRKSKNPLIYSFQKLNEEFSFFQLTLQTPLIKDSDLDPVNHFKNLKRSRYDFDECEIALRYNGFFDNEFLAPLLAMSEKIYMVQDKRKDSMYKHLAIEVIQNIHKHGYAIDDHVKGVISITNKRNVIAISSFNWIDDTSAKKIGAKLARVDLLSKDELRALQMEYLTDGKESGGIGLLNLAYYIKPNNIEWKLEDNSIAQTIYLNCKLNCN